MHGNDVCAAFYKIVNVTVRIFDHQMHVQHQMGYFSDGFQYRHSKGYAGYKHAVHDIVMQILSASCGRMLNVVSQMCKIC